jgi:hypothetical protein
MLGVEERRGGRAVSSSDQLVCREVKVILCRASRESMPISALLATAIILATLLAKLFKILFEKEEDLSCLLVEF